MSNQESNVPPLAGGPTKEGLQQAAVSPRRSFSSGLPPGGYIYTLVSVSKPTGVIDSGDFGVGMIDESGNPSDIRMLDVEWGTL